MSNTAFQTQFRQELILGHEERKSHLIEAVTNEAVIKGNTATFLVSGSSSNTAVTRAVNGMIPYQTEDMTQVSCTLGEWHAPFRKTGFNIFASQGDQRMSMQLASSAVINRKSDELIITQLDTATNNTGAAQKGSLALLMHAFAKLGANKAARGSVTALISPAFLAYLAQTDAFTNIQYAPRKMFEQGSADEVLAFRWMMFNFIVHPDLTGVGTSSEKCYLFNKDSVGFAMDTAGLKVAVGYNEEQDYSYNNSTFYGNAKMIQQSGVIQMVHDASEFA